MLNCLTTLSAQTGLISSLFMAGLVGGVSHCAAMCGPFVIAQQSQYKESPTRLERFKSWSLFPYHMGRITTYIMIGVAFSQLLNLAYLFSPFKAVLSGALLLTAALLFLVSVLPALLDVFPFLGKVRFPAPTGLIMKLAQPLLRQGSLWRGYLLGVLLGFMPCGLVVAAVMAAAGTGDATLAAFGMGLFALGTIPGLMLVAFGGQTVAIKWPRFAPKLKLGLTLVSTGFLVLTAGKLLFD